MAYALKEQMNTLKRKHDATCDCDDCDWAYDRWVDNNLPTT